MKRARFRILLPVAFLLVTAPSHGNPMRPLFAFSSSAAVAASPMVPDPRFHHFRGHSFFNRPFFYSYAYSYYPYSYYYPYYPYAYSPPYYYPQYLRDYAYP